MLGQAKSQLDNTAIIFISIANIGKQTDIFLLNNLKGMFAYQPG